jgi:uridine kinase
MIPDE